MMERMKEGGVPQRRRKPIGAGLGPAGMLREGSPPARLPRETDREYKWLVRYWREGAAKSLREMARLEGVPWTSFCWSRKARSWDARVQAALEEPREVKQAWAARWEGLREEEWKLYRECLAAGREALQRWLESGKAASVGDVVKLLEFGVKLAGMSAGMPDSHTVITDEEGESIRVQFEAALAQACGATDYGCQRNKAGAGYFPCAGRLVPGSESGGS